MSYRCDICGKEPSFGNKIVRRGLAKKKGGVGQKITGISRRMFKPNIQRVRVKIGGAIKRMRVCSRCIKGGKVLKG
jgi:large subunit ribosomal protein L28